MTTKLPGLPPIPSTLSADAKAYLKAVGEVLEVRAGRRGDPLDRAITLRELIDSGLATQLKAAPFDPNNINVGNLGFSNQPTNSAIPPAPTTLTASAGLKYVLLEYNNPKLVYLNHGFTEVYRHTSDTIGDAILVGTSSTFTFSDAPSTAGTYYYWVRFVSDTGVVGPFNATAGTSATIQTDVSFLLQTLTSSISASQLTTSLANQIDGSGSAADLAALETFVGFDSTTSITPGTNDLKALIDLNETAANSVKTMIGWTSTYSGDNLTTRIGDNETDITALQTTVNDSSTGVAASATAISALQTDLTAAEGNISTNTSDITALESTVNDSSTGVAATATALSNLTTRVTTAEGTISTNTSDITTLENTVNDSTSGVAANATAITGLGTRLTTAEGSITSQASDISDLNAEVFDSSGNGVLASITSVNTVSSAVTALEDEVFDTDGTTPRLATASSVSTLNTTVGNNSTSIQTAQTSINGLEGQYTVKIDSNGNVAGFGLANTSSAAGSSSEFTVRADRFAIVNSSNNQTTSPFIVQTTQQTIGGVTVPAGVYIDGAQIKNASITGAKIENATIDNAKITSGLSANKITAGTLSTSVLNIDSSTLTSVGGVLQVGSLNGNKISANTLVAYQKVDFDTMGEVDFSTGSNTNMTQQTFAFSNFTASLPRNEYTFDGGKGAGQVTVTLPKIHSDSYSFTMNQSRPFLFDIDIRPFGSASSNTEFSYVITLTTSNTPTSSNWLIMASGGVRTGSAALDTQRYRKIVTLASNTTYYLNVWGYQRNFGYSSSQRGARANVSITGLFA